MKSEWIWIWCGIVAVASLAGGLLPLLVRWTHRRLQMALSFVSGVMLGVAMFHMLPHAVMTRSEASGIDHDSLDPIMLAATAGIRVRTRFAVLGGRRSIVMGTMTLSSRPGSPASRPYLY